MGPDPASERCGQPVGRWGNQGACGRPKDHPGKHNSVRYAENQREYFAQRYRNRRDFLDALKLEQGCTDCGYRADPRALDFDHLIPGEKSAEIQALMNLSWDRVLEEIGKCVVRCANCHRIRTFREQHLGFRARQTDSDSGTIGVRQLAEVAFRSGAGAGGVTEGCPSMADTSTASPLDAGHHDHEADPGGPHAHEDDKAGIQAAHARIDAHEAAHASGDHGAQAGFPPKASGESENPGRVT
jgi:hypothetical protein